MPIVTLRIIPLSAFVPRQRSGFPPPQECRESMGSQFRTRGNPVIQPLSYADSHNDECSLNHKESIPVKRPDTVRSGNQKKNAPFRLVRRRLFPLYQLVSGKVKTRTGTPQGRFLPFPETVPAVSCHIGSPGNVLHSLPDIFNQVCDNLPDIPFVINANPPAPL